MRRETIPVRHDGAVLAVLSRDTNLAMPRVPSPLEIAYLGSASDLCQMIADGTFPPRASIAGADTQPPGRRRPDPARRAAASSPTPARTRSRPTTGWATPATSSGSRWPTRPARWSRDPFDAAEIADRIEAALDGRHSLRMEVRRPRARSMLVRALPLRPRGTRPARSCWSATSPTCAAATRPCSQGRHDPRDPPPGEEQPADGRGAAAPAGAPHGDPGGPAGARGERAAGQLHRAGARVAVRRRSPSASTSTSWSTRCCRRSATARPRSHGPRCAATAASAPCPPRWPRPLVLVLTELVHNALAHAFDAGDDRRGGA